VPTDIPQSREGYALDQQGRIVHRRWARHARGLPRVRGMREIAAWLGLDPSICIEGDCFPPTVVPKPRASRPTHAEKMAQGRSSKPRQVVEVDVRQREKREKQGAEQEAGDPGLVVRTTLADALRIEREPAEGLPEAASEESEA
jgi:hypothetical protein